MTSATHLDATTLVERIRDHLPIGSAQSYAAMLVLNYLITYVSTARLIADLLLNWLAQ